MDKFIRRCTYSLFFLFFIILTPVLIMYSLGYRYDFNTGNIEKNGAFYVKSYPRGAEIYVADKKSKNKTPTQVTNIKPAIYQVKVTKDGYVPWIKELKIESGLTTFAEDVVLFLNERNKTNINGGGEEYLISANRSQYAYINNNILYITDVEQTKNFEVSTLDNQYELIDWSTDNQTLLLKFNNRYFVFNINQKSIEPLLIEAADKLLWENNSETILYLKNKQLHRYHLNWNDNNDEILNLDYYINDFDIDQNYLIIQYGKQPLDYELNKKIVNYVEQFDKNTLESKTIIDNLSLGKLEILKADDTRLIFMLGAKLYIKSIFQDLIIIPITMADIHDDRLLMTNGHEIILYNYREDWQELIDRSSQIVSEVVWHPNGSYFISETNGKTYLTEIDGRDKRNTIELLENPLKKMYLFNKKGDKLFMLTPEENFYLTIQ